MFYTFSNKKFYLRRKTLNSFIEDWCTYFERVGPFIEDCWTYVECVGPFIEDWCTYVECVGPFIEDCCTYVECVGPFIEECCTYVECVGTFIVYVLWIEHIRVICARSAADNLRPPSQNPDEVYPHEIQLVDIL